MALGKPELGRWDPEPQVVEGKKKPTSVLKLGCGLRPSSREPVSTPAHEEDEQVGT